MKYRLGARKQGKAAGKSVVVPIVVYDLPNRDCCALASNSELLLAKNGLAIYKTDYINPIVKIIQQYPDARVAAIIEPDSPYPMLLPIRARNEQMMVTVAPPRYLKVMRRA